MTDPVFEKKPCDKDFEQEFNPTFMKRALELGKRAAFIEKSGGPFGAVIVKEGVIIAEGYNQVILRNDPTWHAEMHAIREACHRLNTPHLAGCVCYTSAECCPMCLSAAYWAHIDHIYYASTIEDALKYGQFQDSGILDDLRKDPQLRKIKCSSHMRPEAVETWKEYAAWSGRAKY